MKDIFDIIKKTIKLHEYASKVMKLKLIGNRYIGLCPFHSEKTPSFYINQDQDLFYCFGCNKGGDLFTFYCDINNCDKKTALQELSKLAGVKYSVESTKNDLNFLLDYFKSQTSHIEWLQKRGLTIESINKFQLGWSGSFFELSKFIRNKNLHLESLGFKEGLLKSLQNRVMFPIFNEIGSLVSFSGRTVESVTSFKYINGAESKIFHKNDILYGLNFIKNKGDIFLVEGYIDVILMDQYGYSSVAAMGTALSEDHLKKLWLYTDTIIIMLDGDEAGVKASERIALLSFQIISAGKKLFFIQLPKEHDPASYLEEYKSIQNFKKYPLYEYILLNKKIPTDPDERAVFFNRLNELALTMTDKTLMYEYKKFWRNVQYNKMNISAYQKLDKLTSDYLILLLFKYVICYKSILDHVAEDFLKILMNEKYMQNLIKLLNHEECDSNFMEKIYNVYIDLDMKMKDVLTNWYEVHDRIQNCKRSDILLEDFSEESWKQYQQSLNKKGETYE